MASSYLLKCTFKKTKKSIHKCVQKEILKKKQLIYKANIFLSYLPLAIFYGITCLFGTLGNILAIWVAGFKMKTMNAVWILHLAIADLICCLFLTFKCAHFLLLYYKYYPKTIHFINKTGSTAVFLSICASVTFLTAMSIDRCVSIMCPHWYKSHKTPKHVHITAAIIWVISLILAGFKLYIMLVYRKSSPPFRYVLATLLTICFIIIIICYSLICFKLKKMKRTTRSQRPYRVITALIISLFICWAPYYIFIILRSYIFKETLYYMDQVSFSLACFNSCINPIIYVFVGEDFRETLMASLPPGIKTVINKFCKQTPRNPEIDNEEIPNTDL